MVVLALLMAGTSWAVASWVSVWLVPPYLILMALLLSPPAGRPEGEPDELGSESSDSLRPARPVEGVGDDETASDGPTEGGSEPGAASGPSKARRGKARAKRARPLPGPTEATWVQVAPGKFVRVEASETSGQAGPHAPVGVPVEVPSTPQPSEFDEANPPGRAEGSPGGTDLAVGPLEDARPAPSDLVGGGPGGDPIGDVESGSTTALEGDETAGTPGIAGGTPAADGNAPQAGDPFEGTEAGWPDAAFEAVDDRAWAGPDGEGSETGDAPDADDLAPRQRPPEWPGLAREPGDEGWLEGEGVVGSEAEGAPPAEDPGPTGTPALADVPPEDADERGRTLEGADPTETPVDETDLDDAGPIEVQPLETGPSADADAPETVAFPGPSGGSTRRPGRLAPEAWTRVGPPPRSFDRRATPRRPGRSHAKSRRPPDPRRPDRRGLGRSRQVTRTFPPRSPPGQMFGRGRNFRRVRSAGRFLGLRCLIDRGPIPRGSVDRSHEKP